MKMENIEVFVNTNGKVVLFQESVDRYGDDQLVFLDADQVDLIVNWMVIEKDRIVAQKLAGIPFEAEKETDSQPTLTGLEIQDGGA